MHSDHRKATDNLQTNLNKIEIWLKQWRLRVNESKSTHVTFTLKHGECPPATLNGIQLNQAQDTKYLGIYLDRRLTWQKHIFIKRKQLGIKFRQVYWLIGRNSELTVDNKLLVYKSILKPLWTYGIQLWGTASNSKLSILQRFQNKVLRTIVNAPWYFTSSSIEKGLRIPSVREVITSYSTKYNT